MNNSWQMIREKDERILDLIKKDYIRVIEKEEDVEVWSFISGGWKKLRGWTCKQGYRQYSFPFHGNRNGYAKVYEHRIVWIYHYKEAVPHGNILHHCNENKQDNRLENLEVVRKKDHMRHSNGYPNSQLSKEDILKIYNMYHNGGYNASELARIFGVQKSTTARIVKKKSKWYMEVLESRTAAS